MLAVIRKDSFMLRGLELDPGLYVFNSNKDYGGVLPSLRICNHVDGEAISVNIKPDAGFYDIDVPHGGEYIREGDIAHVTGRSLRVILTRAADTNTLLVTERCNNLCLFCSQPPKDIDDEILLGIAAQAIITFNYDGEIGISGGEPLIYGDKFLSFLKVLKDHGFSGSLHILTNGRAFKDREYVERLSEYCDLNITFGIPLYGTHSQIHDELVGAKGAWEETVDGIVNVMFSGFGVEIRFIPTTKNISELDRIVSFVSRSFPLASQLSIMNMEPKGWARKNWDDLYVSPYDYSDKLKGVMARSQLHDMNVRLFNFPLCHIPSETHGIAEKSISDWKNSYQNECSSCQIKEKCGGFFSSAEGKFLDRPRAIQ